MKKNSKKLNRLVMGAWAATFNNREKREEMAMGDSALVHAVEVELLDVTLPQVAMMSSPTEALKLIQLFEKIAGPIAIPAHKTLRLQVSLIDQPAE
jgi:hypothetical protein